MRNEWDEEVDICPEGALRLLRAIRDQAIEDATRPHMWGNSNYWPTYSSRQEAFDWLLDKEEYPMGCRWICRHLGEDPDTFQWITLGKLLKAKKRWR